MAQHLVLTVRLHEDGFGTARYHGMSQGAPEWPPAPARVFQALVAGAARGHELPERLVPALHWLETLPAPAIAAPRRTLGQAVDLFVPNNDADAVNDPRDVSGIRTAKFIQPSLFAADQPLLYAWPLPTDPTAGSSAGCEHAVAIADAALGLYQLGRGIDMAWAAAELLDDGALVQRLSAHGGIVHRPEAGVRASRMLACPAPGSLASLVQRHRAVKLRAEGSGTKARVLFVNPPKPRFASVCYERSSTPTVFELRDRDEPKPWPWALSRAAQLVEVLRDAAASKLRIGLGSDAGAVERSLVGHAADGSGAVPVNERIRIVPMPSIGSVHADRAIRRVLVEVPSGAPLRPADVEWAFSGLDWADPQTGELCPLVVTRSESDDMLGHYVGPSRRWRSMTAVALPESARRRRIDPTRIQQEAKSAQERMAEEGRAAAAVRAALRHAGVLGTVTTLCLQREPFDARGVRAEVFAEGTRFPKERLWHVEFEFDRPIGGPLVIGDGRFAGLGVMAPVADANERALVETIRRMPVLTAPNGGGVFVLAVADGLEAEKAAPIVLARALRRAVMARVRDTLGLAPDGGLDRFFSGHEPDGAKAAADAPRHLAYHWDARHQRLLVIAPHRLERRMALRDERRHLKTLARALDGLTQLRAGAAGCLSLRRLALRDDDPLLASARSWVSLTPYAVTRHRRCASAQQALVADVIAECERYGLPMPTVSLLDIKAVLGQGLQGRVRLNFAVAVAGPIALGRSARLGGGLFCGQQNPDNLPDGPQDGLEDRDPPVAPTATGRAVEAPAGPRASSDLAEHGVRARNGGPGLAESSARSATQPADATRRFDTAEGRLNYDELARRLAGPLLRIDDRIRCGEFAGRPMDTDLLLEFHAALCADLFPAQAGRYRTTAVQVGAHEPPPPHEVAARVLEYTRNLDARLQHLRAEPDDRWLEALAYAEGELLSIHPFPDLNGRVSRLWLSELARRLGLPPVDIVPSDADFRQRYLNALASADRRDWQPLQALWQERLESAGEQP